MTNVAVLGLGAMGSRIARRLLSTDYQVVAWNRTDNRVAPLVDVGATPALNPAEAARDAEVIITMLADERALDAVFQGPTGLLAGLQPGSTVVEMSTVGPAAVTELAKQLPYGVRFLDAPVLGSRSEAENGSLIIFVGGSTDDFRRCEPLLSELGRPVYVGDVGTGSAAKLVANHALLGSVCLYGEALALARVMDLPDEVTEQILAVTPLAEQAERRRSAIRSGTYPPRFSLSLARKDATLINEASRRGRLNLLLAAADESWLVEAENAGLGESDYTAVLAQILHHTLAEAGTKRAEDGTRGRRRE